MIASEKKLKNSFQAIKKGFTLLEVMVALAIIVVMATTVLGVQMTMMRTTSKATAVFERLWHMTNFLRKAEIESIVPESDSFEKRIKVSRPALELIYTIKKPSKNSKLSAYKDLFIERVDSTWISEQSKKNSDALITFLYKPKKAKEESAGQSQEAQSQKIQTPSDSADTASMVNQKAGK